MVHHLCHGRWIFIAIMVSLVCLEVQTKHVKNFLMEKSDLSEIFSGIFKKCMDELGCFDMGPPFYHIIERPISLLPQDRDDIDTTFKLYTNLKPKKSQNFSNTKLYHTMFQNTDFKPHMKTYFIVHGFMSQLDPDWAFHIKNALLDEAPSNVFIVDWHQGDGPIYEQAVANTRVVGAEIARFITFLQDNLGILSESVHIIGHSLGAHIAGYAGKRLQGLGRITGLDPAGPYFENVDPIVRLNASDANFVDVIHTDCATNRFSGFGTTESIGDIDFFPNGGTNQPGCVSRGTAIWDFLKHPSLHGDGTKEIMCNHHRVLELFISSIKDRRCHLVGFACKDWETFHEGNCSSCGNTTCYEMGLHSDKYDAYLKNYNEAQINLYLNTTATAPFC